MAIPMKSRVKSTMMDRLEGSFAVGRRPRTTPTLICLKNAERVLKKRKAPRPMMSHNATKVRAMPRGFISLTSFPPVLQCPHQVLHAVHHHPSSPHHFRTVLRHIQVDEPYPRIFPPELEGK